MLFGEFDWQIASLVVASVLSAFAFVGWGVLLHYYTNRHITTMAVFIVALSLFVGGMWIATAGPWPAVYLWERGDAHLGVWLAVALLFEIAALLAIADDSHFRIAAFLYKLRRDLGAGDIWCANLRFLAIVGEKDFVESYFRPLFRATVELLNIQNTILSDNVLFPPCFYNRDFSHMRRHYTLLIRRLQELASLEGWAQLLPCHLISDKRPCRF